jgi:hypothetical protein
VGSCSEVWEDDYKCTGCKQVTPPICVPSTYRDYSGLEIGTCYDGCPQFDWDVRDEICYTVKNCWNQLHNNSLCIECEGEKSCFPMMDTGEGNCRTIGECVVEVACDIILTCWQCTGGDTVSDTVYEETCECSE